MSREKITISEIVELMTAKNNFSKKQTEEFVKMLLSTIEDVLIDGEVIKIKDFGTFKPQWNEPRKSVDVNTGEEIIVPGYYKVVFVPDNEFKELVNKPFAHLEAVEQKQSHTSENIVEEEENIEKKTFSENVKTPMEPLRVFEEQAAQIKGLLSEIGALKSNTKKQTEQEIENIQNSEEINDEITVEEIESEDVVNDNVAEKSTIENDEIISTSEINTEEVETKTLKIYDDGMSRKQRKKLEKEEEKQRRREEIKRYFDENKFTVIREIQPSKDENAIISEDKIAQNFTLQEKNVKEAEIAISSVENEEQTSNESENFENEELKIETPFEQEVEIINKVSENTNNESEIEIEPIYDAEDQISEQNTETDESEKSEELIISDEISSENIIKEQTDAIESSATENTTEVNNEIQEKTQVYENISVEEKNTFVDNKNEIIEGVNTNENINTTSETQTEIQNNKNLEISDSNSEEIDYKFTPIRKRRKRWFWLIFIPLLIAAISYGIWWYFPQIKPYIQPYIERIIPKTEKKEAITPQKTVVVKVKVDSTLMPQNDTLSANEVFIQEREYKEFIASEITTKEKDIKRIAKDRYGNEAFWIYIYEANNEEIEDPKKIEVGTPVKIPKLDPRLINVNNPECVRYAKKLADEYLN